MTFSNDQKRATNLSKRDLRIARQNKQFSGTGDISRYVRDAVIDKPQEPVRRSDGSGRFIGSVSGRSIATPQNLSYVLGRVNREYDRTGVLPSVDDIQKMI